MESNIESQHYTILHNANQVVCISNEKRLYLIKNEMKDLKIIQNGYVIIGINGKILSVGKNEEL